SPARLSSDLPVLAQQLAALLRAAPAVAHVVPAGEDQLALLRHEVVEAPRVAVDRRVLALRHPLRVLDEQRGPLGGDEPGLVALLHESLRLRHAAHEFVLEAREEDRAARIALTTGASPQLVVQTRRFVAAGPDDEQSSGLGHVLAAQPDVGAASGHLRGDGHGTRLTGARDDLRLAGVVLRVEHLAVDAAVT